VIPAAELLLSDSDNLVEFLGQSAGGVRFSTLALDF
jgi:hypothetical protein